MNRILRALWDRLLPPGGDVAVARDAKVLRAKNWSVSVRQQPRRFDGEPITPGDTSSAGCCWWWDPEERHWLLVYPASLNPGDLWLPYRAIADPDAP